MKIDYAFSSELKVYLKHDWHFIIHRRDAEIAEKRSKSLNQGISRQR